MVSSSTWILSLKVLFISVGVVSLATFMKCSVPLILDEAPTIWSTVVSWLKPPYLYVIINGIIITIAASSRFGHKLDDEHTQSEPLVPSSPLQSDLRSDLVAVSAQPEFGDVEERQMVVYESEEKVLEVVNGSEVVADDDDEDLFVLSRSSWTPSHQKIPQEIETELLPRATEKPLVSARFGHRKPVKSSPEGVRALRVAKPKRHETLENTWKTITDGRHVPLTRHLKKSDTWENHGRHVNVDYTPDHVMKSETFKDRTNYDPLSSLSPSPSSGKVRKEPSLGQDELNRRVEAFIKKFNDEMRLQRQESLNQYMEMINRGAH